APSTPPRPGPPDGVLGAAGILFFAFAGYARIATLGEEVRDPARTVPRAVVLAFAVVIVAYTAVAVTVLAVLGADGVAASPAPVAAAVAELGHPALDAAVRGAAVLASAGALLALLAGLSRTTLAMAREGDLPTRWARIDDARSTPRTATLVVAAVIVVLTATVDIREMIGFSSFGVLLYYAVANIAAARQRGAARRYPRILQGVGLLGCGALVVTLPPASVGAGAAVVGIGLIGRVVVRRCGTGPELC
ncbi:APC family permease, partial [Rhodococcoides corynebacterioides]|uniref:APC family permease n=1 Tax=Rhodococcoides corynebacterioides TaxID=53972 RepID=UPI001C9A8827